jgi:hypothetical protein
MEKAFNDNEDGGFQITFDNNCTISVVYHKYSYSDQGKTTAEVMEQVYEELDRAPLYRLNEMVDELDIKLEKGFVGFN